MSLKVLTTRFAWYRYSRKLRNRIETPFNGGYFTKEEADERGMRLAIGTQGLKEEGNRVRLFWLVDPEDGTIVDAKFQVMGHTALLGAAEGACSLVVGKNYDQAGRISADLLDKEMRDHPEEGAFPWETASHLNLVLAAIDEAVSQCLDIPVATTYIAPPATLSMEVREGGYPGWKELSDSAQKALIDSLLDQEVRPYIALDGGGIEIYDYSEEKLTIGYQGNCTSCLSSVGATLSFIQQTLQNKLSPTLQVIPKI